MLVSEMPHGGLKRSGYGEDLSMYALEDDTAVRHVMVKLKPPQPPTGGSGGVTPIAIRDDYLGCPGSGRTRTRAAQEV